MTLVVMTIAGQAVAVRTERDAVVIIAALETGQGLVIPLGVAQTDGTQGVQIVMYEAQNFIKTFARIPEQFTNFESWETLAQILQTRDGE